MQHPKVQTWRGRPQLILVARTVCWLEYGREFRESTVYSDFSAARIMRQIDARWPGDKVRRILRNRT